MTITLIDLYNKVTGQAWSMFDGEIEDADEFESSVTSSIQKALSALWCSYKFPFRNKTLTISTVSGTSNYDTPNGNIAEKTINGSKVYGVKIGNSFLKYEPDYETLETKSGKPEKFYVKNDKIYLYPTPDDVYSVDVEYWSFFAACTTAGVSKANLVDDTDYIDIPDKYLDLFLNALMPLTMVYAIASDTDENTSGYQRQYEKAYKNLIEFTRGIEIDKRIGWR